MSNTAATPNPVTWFEIHSADPERAQRFYGSVFGWTFDDDMMPGYSMIGLGDSAPIKGGVAHTKGDSPDAAIFMVQVPDVQAALAAVAERGGSVVTEQQQVPTGLTFGYAADPDGSVFGLWCPPAE